MDKTAKQNPPANGSPDESLKKELETAQQKVKDLTETGKRALADLANYKKHVEQEKAVFVQFANVTLLLELLPVLDNFDRAFKQVPPEVQKTDWFKGALQIEQQMASVVKRQGVFEMPSQIGKKLDTNFHEVVTAGPGEKEIVTEEFEKGYLVGKKVLRPAKVKVGNGNKPEE